MHDPDRLNSILKYQLSHIMKTHNWSQKRFAEECDLGNSTVNDFINDKNGSLSFSTVERITDAMGWPLAQLLLEENMMIIPKEGASIPDDRVPDEYSELYRRHCELFFLYPPKVAELIIDFIEVLLRLMYSRNDKEE